MTEPANLFDPEHYREVRRPLLQASSLPSWCYTSDTFYRREVERVFRAGWHLVGREDELAKPGDFRVFDLCGESIIVIRAEGGALGAFANTCRHRGTRLLDGTGNCRKIICPYHAWTYDLDGSLWGLKGMEETVDFERSEQGLRPVELQCWAGFMFLRLQSDGEALARWLGNLVDEFAPYDFARYRCVRRVSYDLACNWKLYIENAMEDYHTPTVHRSSIGLQQTIPLDTVGEWDSIHMEAEQTIAVLPEDATPFPHAEGLSGRPATGTFFTAIYPTTFFGSTQDCMWWLQTIPRGPRACTVVHGACFPESTVQRSDFEDHVWKYYKRWDRSIPEDNDISERQQAGLESAFSSPGRLSIHEPVVHSMANWVLDRVLD